MNENRKIESNLLFKCHILLFIMFIVRRCDNSFSCVRISLICFMMFDPDLTDREKKQG